MTVDEGAWEVRPQLRLIELGLPDKDLVDRLLVYFHSGGVDFQPSATLAADGTAASVGGTCGLSAPTPGAAVDKAVELLERACATVGIATADLVEVVVEPG
ncbi:hypothetical protein ACIRO1_37785 [Streptomyces sp. NPDC102381]|uniref:hypothetical protein n=1 Tax=Streptomyces sp. NPDC102381 TaxID=3366164 RepID=UPI0037FA4D34